MRYGPGLDDADDLVLDFGESMIGRALLEWNSVVGIPLDAWYTLSTTVAFCSGCGYVRSFDGDCAHRDSVSGTPACQRIPTAARQLKYESADDGVMVQYLCKGKGRAFD
jgi:hypothetical protein